jgi:hypothetical protein
VQALQGLMCVMTQCHVLYLCQCYHCNCNHIHDTMHCKCNHIHDTMHCIAMTKGIALPDKRHMFSASVQPSMYTMSTADGQNTVQTAVIKVRYGEA